MRRPTRLSRSGCSSWGARILTAVALTILAAALAAGATARGPDPLVTLGDASAEISFPVPTRHAIVLQEPGKVRRLYARGDNVFHPQDPTRSLTVERINPGAMVFRESPRGRRRTLPSGRPIPGFPGLLFTGTVMLDQLHYRYRAVERITHLDPVLVSLEGSRAVLEVEVIRSPAPAPAVASEVRATPAPQPTPPARTRLDPALLSQVRVQEVGPGIYEVNAADVQVVLDNAGRVLADLSPIVLPALSSKTGLQYRITSAASDGILTGEGFTVTAPKLAQRAGIEVGDTILSVNGRPVDGFARLYGIFREVRRDPALHTVQVELDRRGTRLTKTYRIR